MSNQKEEPKKEIPEVIYDSTTGRKYQRGKFLGKVSWDLESLRLPKRRAPSASFFTHFLHQRWFFYPDQLCSLCFESNIIVLSLFFFFPWR